MENKEIQCFALYRNVCKVINSTLDIHEVLKLIAENIVKAIDVKGCVIRLLNRKRQTLEVSASHGVSEEYLNKGPLSSLHSIASSLREGPVMVYDVTDDPRIQYPEDAKKEKISSILSVPIIVRQTPLGALRVYSAEPWEASLEDVNFVQALALIAGMALEMSRLYKGLKDSIEILKAKRDPKTLKTKRWRLPLF